MYELLRKDLGLCRHVLLGGTIALLVPYLAVIVYTLCSSGLTKSEGIEFFSLGLLNASAISAWLSVFSLAFLCGFVVAGERRDRSAEFLAFLPPRKSMILFSKAIVCVAWVIIVAIVYLAVSDYIVPWLSNGEYAYREGARGGYMLVSAIVCSVFGASWLFSTLLSSPVMAVLAGLVAPYVVAMGVYALQLTLGWELTSESMASVYSGVLYFFGVAMFGGGWWCYILRIEP